MRPEADEVSEWNVAFCYFFYLASTKIFLVFNLLQQFLNTYLPLQNRGSFFYIYLSLQFLLSLSSTTKWRKLDFLCLSFIFHYCFMFTFHYKTEVVRLLFIFHYNFLIFIFHYKTEGVRFIFSFITSYSTHFSHTAIHITSRTKKLEASLLI